MSQVMPTKQKKKGENEQQEIERIFFENSISNRSYFCLGGKI
jgi:hypothetical protein